MRENHTAHQSGTYPGQKVPVERKSTAPDVLVYIDEGISASELVFHAQLVADAMGGNVVLVHVIEPSENEKGPLDPVEWDIQRREAQSVLADVAKHIGDARGEIETQLLEGKPVEQICTCVSKRPQDIIAVFRQEGENGWSGSDPARNLAESDVGSVLMVPTKQRLKHSGSYAKLVVPLDGSSRGESAIPKAIRLARANDAELILCHITPEPQITQIGHADTEALEMRELAIRKNRQVGQEYLSRLKARMAECDVRASTLIVDGTDVRRVLIEVISQQNADFVVFASHGKSNHHDVPMGDVAAFVMSRSPVPVLMVRQTRRLKPSHIFSIAKTEGVRRPSSSTQ